MPTPARRIAWMPSFLPSDCGSGVCPPPFSLTWSMPPRPRLTRFRAHLAQTLAREKNYCLALLFLPFSAFSQEAPFDDLLSPTSLGILETFTTEELAQTSLEELAACVQQHGRGRFADPCRVATTRKPAARHSYRLAPGLDEPLKLILKTTLATIRTLHDQLRAVDRTIAEAHCRPARRPTHLRFGPWPRAGLDCWTAGGDRRYLSLRERRRQWPSLRGSSGSHVNRVSWRREDTALAKTGNPFLRSYLIEAAKPCRTALSRVSRLLQRQARPIFQACPPARFGLDGAQVRTLGGCAAADGYGLSITRDASRPEGGPLSTAYGTPRAAPAHAVGAERMLTFLAHPSAQEPPPAPAGRLFLAALQPGRYLMEDVLDIAPQICVRVLYFL
jgi:hypothetical protein